MDFWAQHKDFVLKVAAGVAVFLVALIVRGVVYGDELERLVEQNSTLHRDISGMKVPPGGQITALRGSAEKLQRNADAIRDQIGWNGKNKGALELKLIEGTLGYLRRFRDSSEGELHEEASRIRQLIQSNVNAGFGQLRLLVRDELVEEAAERNIQVETGVGFEAVVDLERTELLKYLMQLELAARVARAMIDGGVAAIEEFRIETRDPEAIPDANPEFLREYALRVRYVVPPAAMTRVLNRLSGEPPVVPWGELSLERLTRPADHLRVDLTLLALAADTEVAFDAGEEEGR